jgi:hypothetical protein
LLVVVPASAQSSSSQSRQPPPDLSRAGIESAPATVEGCLRREADVPGRKPDIAERAGIAEDYILTETRVVKGGTAASNDVNARGTLYDVQGLSADQLKSNLDKRVQIDGTLEHSDRVARTARNDPATGDLPQLRGKVIRSVSGDCSH